jgi:hypothetical protein
VLAFLIITTITFSGNDSPKKGLKAYSEKQQLNETLQSLEENAVFEPSSFSKGYDANSISNSG